jgi:hypothetical protein
MAEGIALGVRPDLDGRDREHHRLTVAIWVAEGAIASGELPPAVPFGSEGLGRLRERGIVGDLRRVAFYHDIQPLVPRAPQK